MSTDLKIRIKSELQTTEFFTIYQQDLNINVKNFKVGAWEKQYIAPNATFYTILPVSIQLQGRNEQGNGVYKTRIIDVKDYNTSYEIYELDKGLDIRESLKQAPIDGTINLYNDCPYRKDGIILKNNKPLLCASIRPENKLNFFIKESLYVAICDYELNDEFFDAASLTPVVGIDYSGQSYLTITLRENNGTGKFVIDKSFEAFEYPNEVNVR